jgi:hypothetical protein
MISNAQIHTTQATIFTVPPFTSGQEVTMFRVVNESGAARTFTVFINVTGTSRAITPIDTQLPIGGCFSDFPLFQLPMNATIEGVADNTGVTWTINSVAI